MKRILLAVAVTIALAGCSSKDFVKEVQNAKLDAFDSTVTIGQAMDRFSSCAKGTQKWVQDDKSSTVEFSCTDNEAKQWVADLAKLPEFSEVKPDQKALFDIKDSTLRVKFSVPAEGKPVSVISVERTIEWSDGVKKPITYTGEKLSKQIKSIYANEPQLTAQSAGKLGNLIQIGLWIQAAEAIRK